MIDGQDTTGALKNFSKAYTASGDFEVRKLFVEREFAGERLVENSTPTYEDEDEDYAQKPSTASSTVLKIPGSFPSKTCTRVFEAPCTSTLHTINKSPFPRLVADEVALEHLAEGDAVLDLRGRRGRPRRGLRLCCKRCARTVFVRDLHSARGMKSEDIAEGIGVVAYGGFVHLVAGAARVCAWSRRFHGRFLIRRTWTDNVVTGAVALEHDEEGYLTDIGVISPTGNPIAKAEGIEMTDAHWEVVNFLREYYEEYQIAPAVRILVKDRRTSLERQGRSKSALHALSVRPGQASLQDRRPAEADGCICIVAA